jgi:ribosome-interacting GTPase 1
MLHENPSDKTIGCSSILSVEVTTASVVIVELPTVLNRFLLREIAAAKRYTARLELTELRMKPSI